MLDFRQTSERRESPIPTGRRWLIVLALLLGVVVILADRARQPGAWRWLDRLAGSSEDAPAGGIDNRLHAVPQDDLTLDSFVIGKPDSKEEETDRRKGYFPGVDPALLDSIQDNTFSSLADRECSLNLLDVLEKTDERKLRKASEGRVTYAQLFRQPAHYRGRLVTISGVVRRVHRIELPENKYELRHYFKVLLYPKIKPPSPVIAYCLRLPKGFTIGMDVSEEVEVTGFFFKRCAYQAKDSLRTAPTILAKTLQWQKRPAMVEEPAVDGRKLILVAVAAALLALLTAWYVYMRTKPSHPALPDRPPNFDLLKEMDQRNETTDEG
ncbi:MAG: hypothetical protein KKE86_15405 [Planctomycetes bacterium]|nr:hypothetical protein [Planctomycetota bacterium]MBU4400704.1 hypothetical protein [Planctomycetota bacterium]MCG2684253.1 hypothetical protein [Planctomycetales bacterium]